MTAASPEQIIKRTEALKAIRNTLDPIYRECFLYVHPIRAGGFMGSPIDAQQAQSLQAALTDSTATDSAELLSANMMAGITPSNAQWLGLEVGNASEEDKRWLENAAEMIWLNIHQANFDAEGFDCCIDAVDIGWFVLYVDVDEKNGGFVFERWNPAECFISSSRTDGRVDIIHRPFQLSAEQAVAEYGEKNLSADVVKLAKEKPDEKVDFIHAIYPRTTYAVNAKLAKNLPFASCHLEVRSKKIARESGYHEFPCMVPRWQRIQGGSYGIGPVYKKLPDIKMVNRTLAIYLEQAELEIAPPILAMDDGVLNPRTINLSKKKVIVVNDMESMRAMPPAGNWQLAEAVTDRYQASIRRGLMADQLQPVDGPSMTATEVHVRVELIRQQLGPVYGRFMSEYLKPMVERCFGLALRAGVLGIPPQTLMDKSYSVKYLSPVARAQKLEDVTAMDAFENALVLEAQASPEVLDNYDWDAAAHHRAELRGVPLKLMRKPDDVAKLREKRAEDQQAQQQQAVAMQGAMSAAEAGGKQAAGAKA